MAGIAITMTHGKTGLFFISVYQFDGVTTGILAAPCYGFTPP